MNNGYVHGFGAREGVRLQDQATSLSELLHSDTTYPDGQTVLEVGCGVGAQTVILARRSRGARITSIDSAESTVAETNRVTRESNLDNVTVRQAVFKAVAAKWCVDVLG
jgi:cyclopropane fatty-acyl-phospholipid synthase-like methyltransferase